jgi:hypothetical protein
VTRPAVESVVTVEHDGNVTYVVWHRTEPPPRPPVRHEPLADGLSGEEAASVRQVTRHLRRCWRRSQLRRDLRDYAWLIGLLAAVVVGMTAHDHLAQLAHALTGGTR